MSSDVGQLVSDAKRHVDAGNYSAAKSSLLVASCLTPSDAAVHFELWRVSTTHHRHLVPCIDADSRSGNQVTCTEEGSIPTSSGRVLSRVAEEGGMPCSPRAMLAAHQKSELHAPNLGP